MLTIKNTDVQPVIWYALPKYSVDITQALAHGKLLAGAQTTYDPPTTVNILFAFPREKPTGFAALCIAGDVNQTVVFHNDPVVTWCTAN